MNDERDRLELQTYHPLFRVIKTLDELNGGALPSSAWPHKGCGLPRLHYNIELVQDLSKDRTQDPETRTISTMHMCVDVCKYLYFRSGWVVEGDIVKFNVPFDPVELISSFR